MPKKKEKKKGGKKSLIEEVQKTLKEQNRKSAGAMFGDTSIWTPGKGTNKIRILPSWNPDETPVFYKEVAYHYSVGPDESIVMCPQRMAGKRCFICEQVKELKKAKGKGAKKAKAIIEKVRAKGRILYNIVDLNDKKAGIQVFISGPKIFKELLSMVIDEDIGDISDPKEGFDIKIIREGEGLDTEYRVRAAAKATAIKKKAWLKGLNDLDALAGDLPSYEDTKAAWEGEDETDDEEDDDDEEADDEEDDDEDEEDDDEDEEDEDDEDEEDEDDDEEDDDDEEEEERPKKSKKKKKGKKKK